MVLVFGSVAVGSIVQQSHAAAAAVGNEGRMRHERGNGHNIVVGNAGGYGKGNMQGMGNRELADPMWSRGTGAVGGRGMIGNGGNGFGQGIGGEPPLMHPHSIGFGPGTQSDVNRSGVHLVLPHVEEGEEINPGTNESSRFNFLDSDEFPQGFVGSHPFTPLDSDEFPQVPVASDEEE
ncbi:hypothetical protein Pint_07673 [Pistacia integerrima]|uniref:Uncharacterized protein n=1 Tax=Pistacia integerrima TaxID=434235 RepID=A0ACC0XYT0_9ROSI|nr:hypothetical protein Pint_07673 [Pistacia integerrima]